MTSSRLTLLVLWAVAPAAGQPRNTAAAPAPRADRGFTALHQQFRERAARGGVDVLFLGDSLTQGWAAAGKDVWARHFEPLKAANFGLFGDRTQNVLWRITDGKELAGIDPRVTVLQVGTNNLGTNTADETAAGVEAVVRELRRQKPGMRVLLVGLFPRAAKATGPADADRVPAAGLHPDVAAVNRSVAELADWKGVRYVDVGPKLLDKDGGLTKAVAPDFLHVSETGYALWAEAIRDPLAELLKE
jgi:lysophospholipase L1-like esterase